VVFSLSVASLRASLNAASVGPFNHAVYDSSSLCTAFPAVLCPSPDGGWAN
jgi:hypothetical protein